MDDYGEDTDYRNVPNPKEVVNEEEESRRRREKHR